MKAIRKYDGAGERSNLYQSDEGVGAKQTPDGALGSEMA